MVLAALVCLTLKGGTTMGEVRSYLPPDLRMPDMPDERQNGWTLAMAAVGGGPRMTTVDDLLVDGLRKMAKDRAGSPKLPENPRGPDVRTLVRALPKQPTAADLAKAEEALRPLEPKLRLLKAAAIRPVWAAPRFDGSYRPRIGEFENDFPTLAGFKQLALALSLRADVRLAQGKPDEAVQDVMLLRTFGERMTTGYGTTIMHLVGGAVESIANNAAIRVAFHPALKAEHVNVLVAAWSGGPRFNALRNVYRHDLDRGTLKTIASSPTQLDTLWEGAVVSASFRREVAKVPALDRKATVEELARRYRIAMENRERPWSDQLRIGGAEAPASAVPKEFQTPPKPGQKLTKRQEQILLKELKSRPNFLGRELIEVSTSIFPSMEEAERRREAFGRMTYAALALRREEIARREAGSPSLLSALPKDPFSAKTLHYDSERRVLWSVGPDGKDDGGKGKEKTFFLGPDLGIQLPAEKK